MGRLACFFAMALWAASTVSLAASGPLETDVAKAQAMLTKEDLGDGIYVFRAPSDLDYWTSTNSTVIVNDDDVTVFDSCTRAVTAQAVIAEIRKLTPKPVHILINSHWHQDHWSGNDDYAKAFPGLRIIASAQTRDYMKRMGSGFFVHEFEFFGLSAKREEWAAAAKTGKLADGTPLTAEIRARKEKSLAMAEQFAAEIRVRRTVLPSVVYDDEMNFWSGRREYRLMSLTGDASGSTVLYLPGSQVLVTGDVLVSPEDGKGPPPWTTNSYSVTPWVESLRRLDRLDLKAIVPGQGPVMHDKTYLRRTTELFATIIDQVHSALEHGTVGLKNVQAAVNVDSIGHAYAPGAPLDEDFRLVVKFFSKKAMQEALDGAIDEKQ